MKKRSICLFILAALVLSMLVACDTNGPLTVEAAKKIVMKDLGTKESKVSSVDVHLTSVDGTACYAIYVTYNGENYEYVISGLTGEILSKEENDKGHSH